MTVLYLSYDGLLDPLGQSQILPYLKGLSADYRIVLITFEKKAASDPEYHHIRTVTDKHAIDWIPLPYHKSPAVLSTLWDIWKLWLTCAKLIHTKRIDLIHCRSYIAALVGLRLRRKFGKPFIFDMRGFWADERVEGGLWNLANPLYRLIFNFFKRKEKEFLQQADGVVVLTEAAREELAGSFTPKNISVIPCCVDLEHFNRTHIAEAEVNSLRTSLGIEKDAYVIVYLGSLGTWYLTQELFEFFKTIKIQCPPARLLILSPDRLPKNAPEGTVIMKITRADVPRYLSMAQASVFFIKPSFSKKASSATKMAELLAMNIPFVTNRGWGDVDSLVRAGSGGILLDSFSSRDMQTAAGHLLSIQNISGRSLAMNYFSLEKGIQAYHELYGKVLDR